MKPNEPSFFVEFEPPGYHVAVGFVKTIREADRPDFFTGGSTITGQIVNLHNSRPPVSTFHAGQPIPGAWVGLNTGPAPAGERVYAAPCDEDSNFTITGVPPESFNLVIWDENLDIIFVTKSVVVEAGADIALGPIPVFAWFARLESTVFLDINENGFRDKWLDIDRDGVWDPLEPAGDAFEEPGIPEQAVNIRLLDGTLYQSFPTDLEGYVPFDEVFPLFHWLVAEVDFARFKATRSTSSSPTAGTTQSRPGPRARATASPPSRARRLRR